MFDRKIMVSTEMLDEELAEKVLKEVSFFALLVN